MKQKINVSSFHFPLDDPTVSGSPLQAWLIYIIVAIVAVFGVIIIVLTTILCAVFCFRKETSRCELGIENSVMPQ